MDTPVERIASLIIGNVETVSPAEIRVIISPEAPQATALNTGVPIGFPRINSYLLVPNEVGTVVGLIVWLGVERSSFPKRTGMKDFGLIDLPFPLRKLTITPLGTLFYEENEGGNSYILRRGVSVFPSVGDPVFLPTTEQLRGILEAGKQEDRRVCIGTSTLAKDVKVCIDPNKMFGRHLAVLGNTGSGKSCSIAGIIRWSLEAARAARAHKEIEGNVNARFIILDPNGEYSQAFSDYPDVRLFRVPPVDEDCRSLILPAWMWNSHEWCAFANAAPGVQRPILLQALRDMRSGGMLREPIERYIYRRMSYFKNRLQLMIASGGSEYAGSFKANIGCGKCLVTIVEDAGEYTERADGELRDSPESLLQNTREIENSRRWGGGREGYNDFSERDIQQVLACVETVLGNIHEAREATPISEDAPIRFSVGSMPAHLEQIASEPNLGQAAQFISTLIMRIQMMMADSRLGPVVNPDEAKAIEFSDWLNDYIGSDGAAEGQIAILDLSLVPSDVLSVAIAVVSRLIFEAIQRYRRMNNHELPTILVLEEAHSFIARSLDKDESYITPAQMCRQTFERIAREGRKFGLGLVLSSQRPSELSPTVLAQCNTFLLHRMVNDRDQELVGRLVPDNLGGLLKELPSLPSQQAILLGWATPIPLLVDIRGLPDEHRPQSSDPEFWKVWIGDEERAINWPDIVQEWTGL